MGCIVDAIAYPSKYLPRQRAPEGDRRYIQIPVTKNISIYGMLCFPSGVDNLREIYEGIDLPVSNLRRKFFTQMDSRDTSTPTSVSASTSSMPEGKYILVYSHGNAETIDQISVYGNLLADIANFPVLLYDYEGYGASGGRSGERTARRDVEAVYHYVRKTYPEHRLVFMGRSIGSVSTAHIANVYANVKSYRRDRAQNVLAGVIIMSGLASAFQAMRERRCNMKCDCLRNYDKVDNWSFPCLVIHGTHDTTVPVHNATMMARYIVKRNYPEHGRSLAAFMKDTYPLYELRENALFRADRFTLLLIAQGDHNSYDITNYKAVFGVLIEFLAKDGMVEDSLV